MRSEVDNNNSDNRTDRIHTEKLEDRTIQVAMIGAGGMANGVHYPSLASFPDVEIAAICDLDSERLKQTADKYAVERRYADYKILVEEVTPHAVYAIGPPDFMYPVWITIPRAEGNQQW